jgi:hypothetical protein
MAHDIIVELLQSTPKVKEIIEKINIVNNTGGNKDDKYRIRK